MGIPAFNRLTHHSTSDSEDEQLDITYRHPVAEAPVDIDIDVAPALKSLTRQTPRQHGFGTRLDPAPSRRYQTEQSRTL